MADSDQSPPMTAPAPLPRGGGGSWQILVPSAVASQWTLVTLAPDRAGTQGAVGTSAAGSYAAGARVGDNDLPAVAVNMAALLGDDRFPGFAPPVVGGGTGGGGGGAFVPIVFIQNGDNRESGKVDGLSVLKAIFGVFLFGPVAIIKPLNDIMHSQDLNNTAIWSTFGFYWALLSIVFHATMRGNVPVVAGPCIQVLAPFILTFFSYMVILYLYMLMPPSKETDSWLNMMCVILLTGHFTTGLILDRVGPVARAVSSVCSRLVQKVKVKARLNLLWAKAKRRWARARRG